MDPREAVVDRGVLIVLNTKLLNLYQDFESESYEGQGSEICKRTEQLNFFFTNNAEDGG